MTRLAGRARLGPGDAVAIVCFGSSSTQGVGASAADKTYPAQLQATLRTRLPASAVTVINAGVAGETVARNLARLDRDVLSRHPDLVIWQVGTNDALQGVAPERVRALIEEGVGRIKAAGAEVALMDPQPLPAPARERQIALIVPAVARAAAAQHVTLFARHALLSGWLEDGAFTPASLYGGDGLHMNDASYGCLAREVADLIAPPRAVAAAAAGGVTLR